jgi:hypothetical protein
MSTIQVNEYVRRECETIFGTSVGPIGLTRGNWEVTATFVQDLVVPESASVQRSAWARLLEDDDLDD